MKTFIIGDVHGRRAQLQRLLELLPRDGRTDTLVFLGDLIDRGDEIPGVVSDVIRLQREAASSAGAPVICLRGNHEQMLLDFVDRGAELWLHRAVGSDMTFEQYTGHALTIRTEKDFAAARRDIADSIPPDHLDFFRRLPFYYEDDYALYVHAGLERGQHPRDTEPQKLLWTRDRDFFKNYRGKPCVFGHTPTMLLPLRGRLGRHGIYVSHSAIGIDTGYLRSSPLSCLQLPDFMLYRTFASGRATTHHIADALIPEPFRAKKKPHPAALDSQREIAD